MVLPEELLEPVKKRLQMYVLRSDVTITDSSGNLCLIGLCHPATQAAPLFATTQQEVITVNLSATQSRCLVIAETDIAMPVVWTGRYQAFSRKTRINGVILTYYLAYPGLLRKPPKNLFHKCLIWISWVASALTKVVIPARKLLPAPIIFGKTKRALFLAECDTPFTPAPNSAIIDDSTGTEQTIGKVLQAQRSK